MSRNTQGSPHSLPSEREKNQRDRETEMEERERGFTTVTDKELASLYNRK